MTKTPKIPCPFSFFDQENLFMNNLIGLSSKYFHREAKNPEFSKVNPDPKSQIFTRDRDLVGISNRNADLCTLTIYDIFI